MIDVDNNRDAALIGFDDDPMSDRDETEVAVAMTLVTTPRKNWSRFYAELDKCNCKDFEKAVFRYCAERADVAISLRELVAILQEAFPGTDISRVEHTCGQLARKFADGKPGFKASYYLLGRTFMYAQVINPPKAIDFAKGRADYIAALGGERAVRARERQAAREEELYFRELLDDTTVQVKKIIHPSADTESRDRTKK